MGRELLAKRHDRQVLHVDPVSPFGSDRHPKANRFAAPRGDRVFRSEAGTGDGVFGFNGSAILRAPSWQRGRGAAPAAAHEGRELALPGRTEQGDKGPTLPDTARIDTPAGDRDTGAALRSVYQKTVDEAVPDEMLDLLGRLD